MKANIMEIERFAIHDGPGIRSVVFLQGCPLRCPWCANPESQEIKPQLMYNEDKCIKCGTCVKNCPQQAIKIEDFKLVFNRDICTHCKICENNCPSGAINFIGDEVSIDEIVAEVLKDKPFYDESNGGVTISGGEPFVQYNALKELLIRFYEEHISVAVETTGDTNWNKIEDSIPYIDYFLFDLKLPTAERIKLVTKGNGERILENLKKLASKVPEKIILRVPVIPNYSYDEETIRKIIDIGAKLKVSQIHLLPYHTLGVSKYNQLGKEYDLKGFKMLSKEDLKNLVDYGNSKGVHTQAGG